MFGALGTSTDSMRDKAMTMIAYKVFGRRPVSIAEVDELSCVIEIELTPYSVVVAVTLYRMVSDDTLETTGDHVT